MKRLLSILLFTAIGLAAVVGVGLLWPRFIQLGRAQPNAGSTKNPPDGAGTVTVEVITPRRRTTVQPAQVEPKERVEVIAKIAGYLQTLGQDSAGSEIDTGSLVKAGQVLATIAVPELEKELKLKQAMLKEATAAVQAAGEKQLQAEKDREKYEAELAFRDAELKRHQRLYQDNSIPQSILDEKSNQYKAADAALQSALAKIAQSKADLDVAQARVEVARYDAERVAELFGYATVRAPATDKDALYVVTRRRADPGAYLQPGSGAQRDSLLSLSRVDQVKVVMEVPERDAAAIAPGDPTTFQPEALPGQQIQGQVSRFAAALEMPARTMRVEVDVPNAGGKPLYPGMYGVGTITVGGRKGSWLLPATAVRREEGKPWVLCVTNDRVEKVPVTVGMAHGAQVEILEGITEESRVIRSPLATLKPSQQVTVAEAKPK
jgi:RND family efflux transporter MFP subunit